MKRKLQKTRMEPDREVELPANHQQAHAQDDDAELRAVSEKDPEVVRPHEAQLGREEGQQQEKADEHKKHAGAPETEEAPHPQLPWAGGLTMSCESVSMEASSLRTSATFTPLFENDEAVGDGVDVMKVVGDEYRRDPLLLQLLDELQHLLGLLDRQGDCRLVEDDQLRLEVKRSGDGHTLPLAAREHLDERIGRAEVRRSIFSSAAMPCSFMYFFLMKPSFPAGSRPMKMLRAMLM